MNMQNKRAGQITPGGKRIGTKQLEFTNRGIVVDTLKANEVDLLRNKLVENNYHVIMSGKGSNLFSGYVIIRRPFEKHIKQFAALIEDTLEAIILSNDQRVRETGKF